MEGMRVVGLLRRERGLDPPSPLLAGLNLLVALVGARPVVQVNAIDVVAIWSYYWEAE